MTPTTPPLLAVEGLSVTFDTPDGTVAAVQNIDLAVAPGECVGIVGESGSGKSQLVLAILGLLAANGRATGRVRFRGTELFGARRVQLARLRGRALSIVFQDPMTALNPYLTIGTQMTEGLGHHLGLTGAAARARAVEMLARVQIPDAAARLKSYPHELSGGMRQRVMIATALLCRPALVFADEPTTALDVTVQAQILALLADLRRTDQMGLVLITHDLGVIAGLADRVVVMYAGRIVEAAPAEALFAAPRHPYTRALLESLPRLDGPADRPLPAIPGQPPDLRHLPRGCAFRPRCPLAVDRCAAERPRLRPAGGPTRSTACHLDLDLDLDGDGGGDGAIGSEAAP